ncbi:hypothetical protein AN1V17_39580 [Vallitalea sediminicola]
MNYIIDMKPKKGNGICTISCIYNVMSFYGLTIEEYEAYILVNGFQTVFNNGYVAINTLEGIDYELLNKRFDTIWLNNKNNQLKVIIDSIKSGQPVIILMDSSALSFDSRHKKEYDFIRSFIIYGVDLDKNVFLVYDTFHLNEELEIEVINFFVPIPIIIDRAKELFIISKSIKAMQFDYKKILKDNMKHYLNKENIYGEHRFFGINEVEKHISYMEDILFKNNVVKKLEACYYATNTIIYGTFIPMITYLLDFIKNSELQDKETIIIQLKELKTKWNILSNKSMKLTVSKRENQSLQFINRYKETFKNTIDYLHKIVKHL